MNLDYDNIAVEWEPMQKYSPAPRHRRRLIMNLIKNISFKSVLDVGCGRGLMLQKISQRYEVLLAGSDISEKAIIRNRVDFPDMKFYILDVSKEFLLVTFELVICSEVIEHILNFENVIENLARMAEKYLIITVPSCPLFPSDKNMGHVQHFEGTEICKILNEQGFTINYKLKWGYPFFNAYKYMLNGIGSDKIQETFAKKTVYGLSQKIISQILYNIFFLNFKDHPNGYQLIIMAERNNA